MRWKRGRTQGIEDRRGARVGGRGGGLPGGIPVGIGGGGGLILLLIILAVNVLGGGGGSLGGTLDPYGGAAPAAPGGRGLDPAADPDRDLVEFVGYVLEDANDLWEDVFARAGQRYERTTLVLFTDAVQSGCGQATSQTGPFYCPLDRKIYLDLEFFRELDRRFGAPGDFAQAYVVAHEVAHHVQTLLGISEEVRAAQRESDGRGNELSVAQELQADCLAGVWAQSVYERGDLESGDLEEGLNAASAVGDDRIQESAGAAVNPETWTHGSSEQRMSWFRQGFDTGDPAACDTFGG
jgi:uncharacterized protein